MPSAEALVYEIQSDQNRVLVTYQRQPTFEEWTGCFERVFADPQFKRGMGILMDRRRLEEAVPKDYIGSFVRFVEATAEQCGHPKWAMVVLEHDPASFGMGRMAEQRIFSEKMRVFKEMQEAEAWLAENR